MFSKFKNFIIIICILTAALTVGHFALAQGADNLLFGGLQNETGNIIGLGDEDPRIIIANIIRVALGFLGIIAVGLIMYAGWLWMTAGGNEENIEKAKKILSGAVIGLVIILASFGIATYILGKLLQATGGGGSEACTIEGEIKNCGCGGIKTCSNGIWGACVGSTCGSGSSPFYLTSTYPADAATNVIRNAKIRFTFYSSVDSGTVSLGAAGTFKITNSSGAEIIGSQNTAGRRIIFTPDGACGDNPCGAANCLPENETITVEAVNGSAGILSVGGQELDCSSFGVLPCGITFNTGELIDCEDPQVNLDFDQICVAANNEIRANSSDDSGVDSVEFFIDNTSIPDVPYGNNPVVNSFGDSPFSAISFWNAAGYTVGSAINIKATAYDIDDHSASDSKNIVLRPANCCNGIQDIADGEEGIDCGGSCGACDGAACDAGDDDPLVCTTPDDSLCASNFCDTNNCVCVSAPIIDWIAPEGGFCNSSPDIFCGNNNSVCDAINSGDTCNTSTPNGAPGNLITIGGRYFGTTSGTVEFSDDNGASWVADLGGCAESWQNEQIIVKVPNISGSGWTIKITVGNGFEDATDDGRGPNIDFIVNNIERPGLCSISPQAGVMGQEIIYNGLRLSGVSAFFGNLSSSIAGLNSSFNATSGTADVPNLPTGKTTTFVKNNLKVPSNYLRFTKNAEPKITPQITSFSPIKGKAGQYITIYGSGFGLANSSQVGVSHRVYFDSDLSDNTEATFYGTSADFQFPDICADGLWKDNQIIVKVPTGLTDGDDYYLVIDVVSWDAPIDTSGIIPAGSIDDTFKYDESLPLLPSLCKISPPKGPNNSVVSLWGEYFGNGVTAKVKFQLNKFQGPPLTIVQNGGANRINTTVPRDAISGPVSVIQGSDEGNSLNFEVGNCADAADCGGTVCCPVGSFRAGMCADDDVNLGGNGDGNTNTDDCFADIGSSVYEWEFSTGQGGNIGDPCKTNQQTGECDLDNSGCNPGLTCDPSDCTCQPIGTCSGYSLNQCMEGPLCPNSPGACQTLNETITANACDNNYCNSEYPQCEGNCSYSIDKNLCVSTFSCSGENSTLISGYIAVCEKTSGTSGKWQINTGGGSCPSGTFLDIGGKCTVGSAGSPAACTVCGDGLSCDAGECVVDKKVCAASFNCDAGICEKEKDWCECCCRVAEEEADCCLGLTCEPNLCDPNNSNYGQCTGCRIEVGGAADQNLSDAACNCEGTTNKVCDMNFDADNDGTPEGVCGDGIPTGGDCSGLLCPDTGAVVCGNTTDFCDPDKICTCQPIGVGTPCDDDPLTVGTCEPSTICEQSATPGLTCNIDTCTCQQSGNDVGESCEDPDNPPACLSDPCKTGLSCQSEDQNACGSCCCTVGEGDLCGENLICNYAEDAGGCTDNNQGVAPDFGLCCGCSSDGQCGGDVSAIGCGDDTCCRPRPEITSVVPPNGTDNICRNGSIEVNFNKKMDIKSFSGNVVVVGDYGFGVCPEGTEYILAADENKGFFAKIFFAPVKFVKKIFYLLNPDARALTVNFCAIPGKVSGKHNTDGTTTLTFEPNDLLDGGRKYYVIIKGDGDLNNNIDEGVKDAFGVSMADNWPDFDNNGSAGEVSDRTFNGTVYYGYGWYFTTMSILSANSGVCKIDHVEISPSSYLFKTVEDDVKENDTDPGSSDFDKKEDADKVFSAIAISADGQPLSKTAVYDWNWEWQPSPTGIINFDGSNPFAAIDSKQLFEAQTGVTDGKGIITATANVSGSMAEPNEFYSDEADVWVFICENPWPPIDSATGLWSPWSDAIGNCGAGGGNCPNTNYNLYYCRDTGATGTVDDLPAILSDDTVIRGASSIADVLKEFYFMREKAPDISGGINLQAENISTTDDGAVRLSWTAPTGGESGYKVYYGASSGNYSSYEDVGNVLTKEISGLSLNKTYYFTVTAYYETGAESGYSPEKTVFLVDETPSAAPSGLNLGKACDGQVEISWAANTDDAVGYKVYYGAIPEKYGDSYDVKEATSAAINGLTSGRFYFVVTSYDASGNESDYSDMLSAVVSPICPVSYWPFEVISDGVTPDAAGNNNGTVVGAVWIPAGKEGGALSFSANNNYVLMEETPSLKVFPQENWSFTAWIRPTEEGDDIQTIFDGIWHMPWIAYRPVEQTELGVNKNSITLGFVRSSNGIFYWKLKSDANIITPNQWNYIGITSDGVNYKLYVNGALAQSVPYEAIKDAPVSYGYRIGNTRENINPNESFVGLIDEVYVYNKVLSDQEVKLLYNSY